MSHPPPLPHPYPYPPADVEEHVPMLSRYPDPDLDEGEHISTTPATPQGPPFTFWVVVVVVCVIGGYWLATFFYNRAVRGDE